MRIFIFLLLGIFFMVIYGGCGEKSTQISSAPTDKNQTAPPRFNTQKKWKTIVEDLRIREEPDLNGKVLMKVAYGTLMDDLNEVTDFETEVTLQGEKKKAPWIKVRTRNGQECWAHQSAVEKVEAVTSMYKINPIDTMKVIEFNRFLYSLPTDQPESMKKATEEWKKSVQGQAAIVTDFALMKLMVFGRKITDSSWEWEEMLALSESENKGLWVEKPHWHANMEYNSYTKRLASNGLLIDSEEGMTFAVQDMGNLILQAGELPSPAMKAYLKLEDIETRHRAVGDAALVITPIELAERTINWENFNKQYPDFIAGFITENHFRWDVVTLVLGLDNTPAAEYETHLLSTEFKQAYEWIIEKHPQTQTGKTIKELYDLLKTNNFNTNTPAYKALTDHIQAEYRLLEVME